MVRLAVAVFILRCLILKASPDDRFSARRRHDVPLVAKDGLFHFLCEVPTSLCIAVEHLPQLAA